MSELLGGYTLLMIAAEEGSLEEVNQLLPSSVVNQRNKSGCTALTLAVKNKHPEVAKILLKNKADPNVRNNVGFT